MLYKFDEVTVNFLKKYELMMAARGLRKSTVGIYLRHLRTIMNIAKAQGIISAEQYPFGRDKYEIPHSRKIPQALDIHEISAIYNYTSENREEQWARDMWLFSFYANGMNMVDIFNLQYKNIRGGFLYFIREKTKNTCRISKEMEIYITQPMQTIIDYWGAIDKGSNRYIFEVFDSSMSPEEKKEVCILAIDILNKRIKRIARNLGITKRISTSVARYSWATMLMREGVPMTYISKGLGHTSYLTTEKYLADFDQDKKIEVGNVLINAVRKADRELSSL